jgi:hypothetical protein
MRTTRQSQNERAERALMRLLRTLPELQYRGSCLLCGADGTHADTCLVKAMHMEVEPMLGSFAPWAKRRMELLRKGAS